MEKTLVAIFDEKSDAQEVLEALGDNGFSSSNMRIASADNLRDTPEGKNTNRPDQEESFGEKLANFFGFGDQDETYTEAVRRGSYVLTVDVASDDEAERAEDIINEYDPIDIDTREAEWRESGWLASQGESGESMTPIVEEDELQTSERAVRKGSVRVISRATERPLVEQPSPGSGPWQSGSSRYTGAERRMNEGTDYRGTERRAA